MTLARARRQSRREASVRWPAAPLGDDLGDLAHDLFAVAEHEGVDEVGQWLGVVGAVPAADDDGVRTGPLGRPDRCSGQVDAVEDVGVDELGGQVERQHVEGGGRQVVVHREQRQALRPEAGFEVGPGGVGPLGDRVRPLVEDLVEDLEPLVGQPDLVGVGIAEQPGHTAGAVFRRDRPQLAPDVAGRLLDLGQERLQLGPHGHDRSESTRAPRLPLVRSYRRPGGAARRCSVVLATAS